VFLLLYPISRVTTDPGAMQLLHLGIALARGCRGVARGAPARRLARTVRFGYFPLYELRGHQPELRRRRAVAVHLLCPVSKA